MEGLFRDVIIKHEKEKLSLLFILTLDIHLLARWSNLTGTLDDDFNFCSHDFNFSQLWLHIDDFPKL